MKKIMRSVLFLAAVFTMASCSNDWLDVDPSDSLPTSEAISNYKDATSALNGIYDGLQGNSDAVSSGISVSSKASFVEKNAAIFCSLTSPIGTLYCHWLFFWNRTQHKLSANAH